MYGLMIAVGLLACFLVVYYYGKKKNIESKFTDFIFFNAVIAIAIGWGSATLFQATYNYIAHPEKGFHLGTGFTFIGGLIGGIIGIVSLIIVNGFTFTITPFTIIMAAINAISSIAYTFCSLKAFEKINL